MQPNQALQLLDQIVSQVRLDRDTHVQAQLAVQTLREAIKPKPVVKKKA